MNTKDTPVGMYILLFLQFMFVVLNTIRFSLAISAEELFPAIEYGVFTICSVVALIGLLLLDTIRTGGRD